MATTIEWIEFPLTGFTSTIPVEEADLAALKSLFPGCDPSKPPWNEIETELLRAGHHKHDIGHLRCRRLVHMLNETRAACEKHSAIIEYVTLLQMSAIVSRDKKTLQRLYAAGELPTPAIEGGSGKQHEWKWRDVRPILEKHYRKDLPEFFPSDRFIRS